MNIVSAIKVISFHNIFAFLHFINRKQVPFAIYLLIEAAQGLEI